MKNGVDEVKNLLLRMGLNVYQASVLATLIHIGETKATVLSKVSNVPTAKVYEVLDELVRMGLVTVKPGRPALYSPVSPEDIASSMVSWSLEEMRRKLDEMRKLNDEFIRVASKVYLKGKKGLVKKPLIRIMSVGEVSEKETRKLYEEAREEILILSQAFEYFPKVLDELVKASERGVRIKIILRKPEKLNKENRRVQDTTIETLKKNLDGKIEIRFVDEVPLRGSIIDPRGNGKAIFLVEEAGVPLEFREAALTTNPGLIKSLALMFNLLWSSAFKHE